MKKLMTLTLLSTTLLASLSTLTFANPAKTITCPSATYLKQQAMSFDVNEMFPTPNGAFAYSVVYFPGLDDISHTHWQVTSQIVSAKATSTAKAQSIALTRLQNVTSLSASGEKGGVYYCDYDASDFKTAENNWIELQH